MSSSCQSLKVASADCHFCFWKVCFALSHYHKNKKTKPWDWRAISRFWAHKPDTRPRGTCILVKTSYFKYANAGKWLGRRRTHNKRVCESLREERSQLQLKVFKAGDEWRGEDGWGSSARWRTHTLLPAEVVFDENTSAESGNKNAATCLWIHFRHCLINISAHYRLPRGETPWCIFDETRSLAVLGCSPWSCRCPRLIHIATHTHTLVCSGRRDSSQCCQIENVTTKSGLKLQILHSVDHHFPLVCFHVLGCSIRAAR